MMIFRILNKFDYPLIISKNWYKKENCFWVTIFNNYFKNAKFS